MKETKNESILKKTLLYIFSHINEVKFENKWVRAAVSWLLKTLVRKKSGYDADIQLNHFRANVIEDKAHVHLDIDLELPKDQLDSLIKEICR